MITADLIALLKAIPADREILIATPNPKYPNDIEMDDIWTLCDNEDFCAGTHGAILVAKAKVSEEIDVTTHDILKGMRI